MRSVEFRSHAPEPADCTHGRSKLDIGGAQAGDEAGGHFAHSGFRLCVDSCYESGILVQKVQALDV